MNLASYAYDACIKKTRNLQSQKNSLKTTIVSSVSMSVKKKKNKQGDDKTYFKCMRLP